MFNFGYTQLSDHKAHFCTEYLQPILQYRRYIQSDRSSTVFKVLCYKSEGRSFKSR